MKVGGWGLLSILGLEKVASKEASNHSGGE